MFSKEDVGVQGWSLISREAGEIALIVFLFVDACIEEEGKTGNQVFFVNFCPCLALLECGPNELHMFDRVHTLDQVHEFKNHIKQAKLHLLDPDYLWTQLEAISPLYKCTLRTMLFVHVHSLSPI